MATDHAQQQQQEEVIEEEEVSSPKLRYLGCFQAAGQKATGYVATIYELAKENSGPLKPGVDSIEGTVKTVVGPVYDKFEGKPMEFLEFLDKKVGETLVVLDQRLPPVVKDTTQRAFDVAKQAPDAAKTVVADVQKNGLYESVRVYYVKYEPIAEAWTIEGLKKLKTFPGVPRFIDLVAPSALFGAEKFNQIVSTFKDRNVPLSGYIPLVPVEKIEQALRADPRESPVDKPSS
ncbi:hypothetical protein SELMODRAFT_450884 [Selaginella moellendorffii]|uniref:Small rubber particle protein n=1 Tax=Selaginella moellendorffii TaxID=88036 RepID=D8TCJ9_SELML|nr:stress-related protein [Selaginella moellendorffii]XP_024522759.1 stress-related protein [Selaginella moellendorffii]EFJ05622.1 hypothetical protein SELMODRAFT_450884 [Selaginella moellendorffii]|eukprot:XP_024522758.1 stress-related protein [Selaginella moellendorffii]